MDLKKELQYRRKDWMHRNYCRIINDFKEYEKVSRNKMIEEVYDIYSDYNNIISICSYKEIELLNRIIKNKKTKKIDDKYKFEYNELRDKFILFNCIEEGICIPTEIIENIKLAIKNCNKNEKKENDTLNELLIGLLKIYGALTPNQFYEITSKYIDIDINKFNEHIRHDKNIQFYCYLVNYKNEKYLVYEPYYYFSDILLKYITENNKLSFSIRPIEEVRYLRYNQFNDSNENITKFLTEIGKLNFFSGVLFDKIEEYVVLNNERESLIEYFKNIPILKNENLSHIIDLMNKAMNDMPSSALKGATRNEYFKNTKKEKYDNKYEKTYGALKNKNSIIDYKKTREETNIVFDECMMFVYENRLINKFDNIVGPNNLIFRSNETNTVCNLMLFHSISNEPSIFEEYCKKHANIFNSNYKIINEFKNSYIEGIFIIKKLNSKLGQVELENVDNKKKYTIMDVALSCASKEIIGNYIYTSLITINNYTFTTDYSFILIKKKNKNIIDEINKKMRNLKNITNNITKRFIACYLLFVEEDITFTTRILK